MARPVRLTMSLEFKIMAGVMGLILLFGAAIFGHTHHGVSRLLREELDRRGVTLAGALAHGAEECILTDDPFALHELLGGPLKKFDDVRYAYVKDRSGRVLAHTFPGGFPLGLSTAHTPKGAGESVQVIDTEEGRIRDISLPLLGGKLGTVHVGMEEYTVRGRILHLVKAWSISALGLLLAGAVTAYWLTHRLSRRLAQLVGITERIGQGVFAARAAPGPDDEVGRLARAFNRMAADLASLQEQLIRSGKLAAIGELSSSVAHEINNPLNTMAVCTQALRDRAVDPALRSCPAFEDFPEYLDAIHGEIFRCKGITAGLLDFARNKSPARITVDINQVVRETASLVSPKTRDAPTSLELRLGDGLPLLQADPDQLKQVLINLLINAFAHAPDGSPVNVATSARDGCVLVTVRDTGCGIRPEHMSRLFQPFFTTKPQGHGTGLGLAVCQKIMDGHGGRIDVASRPGEGSTFTVTLPAPMGPPARENVPFRTEAAAPGDPSHA